MQQISHTIRILFAEVDVYTNMFDPTPYNRN